MEGAIKGVYCSLPRIIATPIKYSFCAYFRELYIKEFDWSPTEYSKLYWIYTLTQIFSFMILGYLLYEIVKGLSEDCKLKYSKWIEIGSIILLSVRTIIWNLLCRARINARNYMTPYETYPFEKAERDKRIRIIRSMFPDLLDQGPNAKSRFILQSTLGQDPELAVNSLPRLSVIDWSKVFRHLSLPFRVGWNLLCRGRTTARNYLTPYEIYPAENAERQKRLRIIRSMFPELANPLPQPEPNIESYSDPIVNSLPKPSLLSKMRSLFKPKSRLRSPYDFPFSPVEFGGVPDLTATWTMVWYKSPDPLIPEVEYKPSLRERLNYFRNRGSYNVAKYDPPVPEMYIPPEPVPSISKSTPTSSLPPPIPPIKRAQLHEPIEQLPEPKSIPNPTQGPIPYITPGPFPVDSIPEPKPITEPEIDSIFEPEPVPSPIRTPSHNIPRLNNRSANSFSRRLKSFFGIFVSKRSILYIMTILHGLGVSSFDLCNKTLSTYIYPEHIADDPDGNKYDKNDTLRIAINTISAGVFAGASFFVILLFSFVKNFAHSKTAFSNTFFIISILFLLSQIPVLYFFHKKAERNSNAEDSLNNHQCLELRTDDYLKLISFIIFHATTLFWIFTTGLLIDYVSISTIDDNLSIIAFVISIIILGFPVISWLHIGVVTLIRNTCGFLFDCGDSQLIIIAACIIGQGTIHYLFNPHNYWWNVGGVLQFFIFIIIGIANTILLIHIYVMFDNVLKKNTVNNWKWLVIGIFCSVMSLVTYSAIYITFSSYYNNEIIESTCNLPCWIYRYDFPTAYKLISFIFQLANVAAYAIYYLVHSCDMHKKRSEEEKRLKMKLNESRIKAENARDRAEKYRDESKRYANEAGESRDGAEKAQKEAENARDKAGSYKNKAEEQAKKASEDARKAEIARDEALSAETKAKRAQKASEDAKEQAKEDAEKAVQAKREVEKHAEDVKQSVEDAKRAQKAAEDAKEQVLSAQTAVSEELRRVKREAQAAKDSAEKIAKDAEMMAAYALEVALYSLKVAAWSKTSATKALEISLSVGNLAAYALNFALSAIEVSVQAQRDASYARMISEDARNLAVHAKSYSEAAQKFSEAAREDSKFAKSIAEAANTIAQYAKGDALNAKRLAEEARNNAMDTRRHVTDSLVNAEKIANKTKAIAEQAKEISQAAGKKASEAETKASNAERDAKIAKRIADQTKKSLEASEKIVEAFSRVERDVLKTVATKIKGKAGEFMIMVNEFDDAVQKVIGQSGNNQKVQDVLTYLSSAVSYFRSAIGKFSNQNGQSVVDKFQEFAYELQHNTSCTKLNLNLMSILHGLVTKIEAFQIAAKNFNDKTEILNVSRKSGKQLLEQFEEFATKFSEAANAFKKFAHALKNGAEYFAKFANALQHNTNCGELRSKAYQFNDVTYKFYEDANQFDNMASSFRGQASQIVDDKNIRKIREKFKTGPTGTQLAQKFMDAANILYEAIKDVAI